MKNKKSILLLSCIALLSVALVVVSVLWITAEYGKGRGIRNYYNMDYEEGVYRDLYGSDWDSEESWDFPVEGKAVPDKETALRIASAILITYQEQGELKKWIPKYVFYDTEKDAWMVWFQRHGGLIRTEPSLKIYIRASNAEIIEVGYDGWQE